MPPDSRERWNARPPICATTAQMSSAATGPSTSGAPVVLTAICTAEHGRGPSTRRFSGCSWRRAGRPQRRARLPIRRPFASTRPCQSPPQPSPTRRRRRSSGSDPRRPPPYPHPDRFSDVSLGVEPFVEGLPPLILRDQRRRWIGAAVRRRSDGVGVGGVGGRRGAGGALPGYRRSRQIGRGAGAAGARLPPRLRVERAPLRQLHGQRRRHRRIRVRPRELGPRGARGGRRVGADPADDRPAIRQPQRRDDRVRRRRLPVHRYGRWRIGRRPAGERPGSGHAPRQDAAHRRRLRRSYGIPADNPFRRRRGVPEIWSFGLRNPWRFSFDRETGAMFIGDVGQGAREEVDAEPAGAGGRNYGWNIMEGDICFRTDPCDTTGLTMPVAVNDRSRGECAITGGYVYRGATARA